MRAIRPFVGVVLGALVLFAVPALATTITVNDTVHDDPLSPSYGGLCKSLTYNNCTLRAAVMLANVLSGGPHTIAIPNATITLTIPRGGSVDDGGTGHLDVTASMTIQGTASPTQPNLPGTVIDGGGSGGTLQDRLFHVHAG